MPTMSLVFHIFNKEDTIHAVIASWLSRVKQPDLLQVILIIDDTHDESEDEAAMACMDFDIPFKITHTRAAFEIGADNIATAMSDREIMIYAQDDNYMFTPGWDDLLRGIMQQTARVGAVGLLAGVVWQPDNTYRRVEMFTPNKGECFTMHNIHPDDYPLGVWQVDYVTRPLAMYRPVVMHLSGFDWRYYPMDWDESDLSWRAHLAGFQNVVAPFDVRNHAGKFDTLGKEKATENFVRGRRLFFERHFNPWDASVKKPFKLFPLYNTVQDNQGVTEWALALPGGLQEARDG